MKRSAVASALLLIAATSLAIIKPTDPVFYVYDDGGSPKNHYIPAGWMGDFGDLKMNQRFEMNPATGKYAIQIKYSAERKQSAGWAGIYWQHPANNWGNMRGGFDLTGYTKCVFKARGEKGGEYIDKFLVGGITGQTEEGDSDNAETEPIELTKDWKEYTIDLKGLTLTSIIGGFGFAVNADMNEKGVTFYLDDIRYVK